MTELEKLKDQIEELKSVNRQLINARDWYSERDKKIRKRVKELENRLLDATECKITRLRLIEEFAAELWLK